jgi:hypothetical protein
MPLRRPLLVFTCLALAAVIPACGPGSPKPDGPASNEPLNPTPGFPWFVDASNEAKISFNHFDSATPMHYIPEVMGSGVGWIDYDADGWPDLFCIQDCPVRPEERTGTLPTHKLFHNNGDGTFSDVTDAVGLNKSGYGMGCAVGDFNNDGFDDLAVTYLDGIRLFENRPDGKGGRRFEDVTRRSGIVNPHWGTSCGWGDVDGDGLLDLYVCNYVQIDLANYKTCENTDVNQVYVCSPIVFPVVAHKLFRNNGNGSFTDVSVSSGIAAAPPGGGLGVVLIDLDGDGRIDLYVANDMKPAYLFHNVGEGKFKEKGLLSGASLMPGGRTMAGMGVTAGDIDRSGRPSLLVSNFQNEPTMVFLNRGKMNFLDWTYQSGLGQATTKTLGFGLEVLDADLDGNLDAGLVNGHVVRNSQAIFKAPYEQSAQFFAGDGQGRFTEVSDKCGTYFREKHVGRGLAVADYNNDGRPDLAVSNNAGPVKLLRNETATTNHWIRLELEGDGQKSNRSAIGARIEVEVSGRKLVRWIHGGGSYLSASDRRVIVGLGRDDKVDRASIVWPSGRKQEFTNLAADRGWRFREGDKPIQLDKPKPR